MTRTTTAPGVRKASALEEALGVLRADELRALILECDGELDPDARALLQRRAVDRALRAGMGWDPAQPLEDWVERMIARAQSAKQQGYADPAEVQACVHEAWSAFLGRHYGIALRIYAALLLPIRDVELDLARHERLDAALGVDLAEVAAQYVVATYMSTGPSRRAEALRTALHEVHAISAFVEPLAEMQRIAVEPLKELGAFLPKWRALLESILEERDGDDDEIDEAGWLLEVRAVLGET